MTIIVPDKLNLMKKKCFSRKSGVFLTVVARFFDAFGYNHLIYFSEVFLRMFSLRLPAVSF